MRTMFSARVCGKGPGCSSCACVQGHSWPPLHLLLSGLLAPPGAGGFPQVRRDLLAICSSELEVPPGLFKHALPCQQSADLAAIPILPQPFPLATAHSDCKTRGSVYPTTDHSTSASKPSQPRPGTRCPWGARQAGLPDVAEGSPVPQSSAQTCLSHHEKQSTNRDVAELLCGDGGDRSSSSR